MATNSALTTTDMDRSQGVYINWDGDTVGAEIQRIIDTHGVEQAVEILMSHHWYVVDSHTRADQPTPENTEAIAGFGVFLTDAPAAPFEHAGLSNIRYIHTIDMATGAVVTGKRG